MNRDAIMASGRVLLDEVHSDGGLGLRVVGLPDGALAVRARTDEGEAFFVVGALGTQRLGSALSFWLSTAPVVAVPTPEPAPNDE